MIYNERKNSQEFISVAHKIAELRNRIDRFQGNKPLNKQDCNTVLYDEKSLQIKSQVENERI